MNDHYTPYGRDDDRTVKITVEDEVLLRADVDDDIDCDGYPEHRGVRTTYDGPDGVQWECTRCGAEGWEDKR